MQTSKQRIKAAIHFEKPDMLPLKFRYYSRNDVHKVKWNYVGTGSSSTPKTTDEWGCVWERTQQDNMGQVTGHPLADWDAVKSYKWLDPDDPALYEGMEEKFAGYEDKYSIASIFMLLFERMHSLRGFENLLMDFYIEKEKVAMLADKVVEIQIGIIENLAKRFPGKYDGLTFTDDWGTERDLIIQPALWREFFKPRYKKIFDACHKAGWDVWMHSCGRVNVILEDLIEIGLDVINLLQPNTLGIKEIGDKFAGRICFESMCDMQTTLPLKGYEDIKKEAKLLLDSWGTDEGGFILCDFGEGSAIGVTADKRKIMYDAFMECDRWKKS